MPSILHSSGVIGYRFGRYHTNRHLLCASRGERLVGIRLGSGVPPKDEFWRGFLHRVRFFPGLIDCLYRRTVLGSGEHRYWWDWSWLHPSPTVREHHLLTGDRKAVRNEHDFGGVVSCHSPALKICCAV